MMTAALRGFNLELNQTQAQRVNDVYSELAAITAADTEEISIAMTKTASIAENANMELETTAAFLSQIIETTREAPETAGTALKTIIARFQELKKAPSEIEDVDGESVDANKIEGALRSIGVALRDTSGQFRDLDDVFLDISKKWDGLTMNQQRYIATMAAGSRQQSRFIAMMSDYDRTMELVDAANNSAGSSQRQFEKTTESLETKINHLTNSWQTFVQGLANNSFIKTAVDVLAWILDRLNAITDVLGANTIGDFVITLTLVLTLFTKLKNGLSDILQLAAIFKGGYEKGIARQTQGGLEEGAKAAADKIEEVVEKAVEKGTKEGMEKGSEGQGGNSKKEDNNVPQKEDATNSNTPLGKAKNWVQGKAEAVGEKIATKFGSIENFMRAVSAAAIAVSGATALLQHLEDVAYETAEEQLETVQSLKTEIEEVSSSLEEKILAVDSQKASYDDNRITIGASGGIMDDTSKKAIKTNNELIRTIRSEFPKLAEYTKYENGQWIALGDFWSEYESALNEQKESLDQLTTSLKARESQLSYEAYTGGNIQTSNSVSEAEEETIQGWTSGGAVAGGVVGAYLLGSGATAVVTAVGAKLGAAIGTTIAPVIGTAIGAGFGALIGGAAAWLATDTWANTSGVSQEQIDSSAKALAEYGTLTQSDVEKLLKNDAGDNDELKELLSNLGGAETFSALYDAADGNVDVLNQLAVEYENTISKQKEYRQELAKFLGLIDPKDATPEDTSKTDLAIQMAMPETERKQVQEDAEEKWKKFDDSEKTEWINEAAKQMGYSNSTGAWRNSQGVLSNAEIDHLDEIAEGLYVEDKIQERIEANFGDNSVDDYVEGAIEFLKLTKDDIQASADGYMSQQGSHIIISGADVGVTSKNPALQQYLESSGLDKKTYFQWQDITNRNGNGVDGEAKEEYFERMINEYWKSLKKAQDKMRETDWGQIYDQMTSDEANEVARALYGQGYTQAAKTTYQLDPNGEVYTKILGFLNGSETTDSQKEDLAKVLSTPISSLDDILSLVKQLEQLGFKFEAPIYNIAADIAESLKVKDVGNTISSDTVSSIAGKLSSGEGLSESEANTLSLALGKGGVTEGMSTEQLYDAGFMIDEEGNYLLTNGISIAEAMQALLATQALDIAQIRQTVTGKNSDSTYDQATLSGMDTQDALSMINAGALAEQGLGGDTEIWTLAERQSNIANRDVRSINEIQPTETSEKAENIYLDNQITLNGLTEEYLAELEKIDKTDKDAVRQLKIKYALQGQYNKKVSALASTMNEVSDDLQDQNKKTAALAKIQAKLADMGLNLSPKQIEASIDDIEALTQGGEAAKAAMGRLAKQSALSSAEVIKGLIKDKDAAEGIANEFGNVAWQLQVYGTADLTNLKTQIEEAGGDVEDVMGILSQLVGSNIAFEITYKEVEMAGGIKKKVVDKITPHVTQANNYSPSSNSRGSSGGGSSSKYENDYDKRYNLVEDIAEEQRTLNKLEAKYEQLLTGSNTQASKLTANLNSQLKSLEKQETLNKRLLAYRKQDMQSYLKENSKYASYATYNSKDNTIEINWDKINAITNSEKGEKVDDYISGLEEAQSRIEEVEDTLLDIQASIKDLGSEQRDQYISSLNQVRDAIVESRQTEIDRLNSINNSINDQTSKMFNAIQDAIDEERQARENEKTEKDIADKERRLAQLQMDTGGGHQAEILQLQDELKEARENYGDSLVDQQLADMQERADKEQEAREQQISLMEEQLELYQRSEEIWNDVYDLWNTAFKNGEFKPGSQLAKLLMDTADYQAMSEAEKTTTREEWGENFAQGKTGQNLFFSNRKDLDMAKEYKAASEGKYSSQSQIDYSTMNEDARNAYMSAIAEEGKSRVEAGKGSKDEKAKWGNTNNTNTNKDRDKDKTVSKLNRSANGNIAAVINTVVKDGVTGTAVKSIQKGINALIKDGFITGIAELEEDGVAGRLTVKAIQKLQTLVGTEPDGKWGPASKKAFRKSTFNAYATGGLADYTGPAWLDGTKSHPELVLNARDTENFIQLKDILADALKRKDGDSTENGGDNYYEIHINVEKLEDDYDVEQMADRIKTIIQQDAMYRNVTSINRLR